MLLLSPCGCDYFVCLSSCLWRFSVFYHDLFVCFQKCLSLVNYNRVNRYVLRLLARHRKYYTVNAGDLFSIVSLFFSFNFFHKETERRRLLWWSGHGYRLLSIFGPIVDDRFVAGCNIDLHCKIWCETFWFVDSKFKLNLIIMTI